MSTFSRRHLPHLHEIDQPIFITWRLKGSLPANRVFPVKTTAGEAFVVMDSLLDGGTCGPLHLGRADIARLVVDAILYGEEQMKLYELHAFVVMANHVHLLITPFVAVTKITHSLKRFTAKEANRVLGSTGQTFWQDESYDHLVRDDREFGAIVRYIENNPVRAGLVEDPESFQWSSAGSRGQQGARR